MDVRQEIARQVEKLPPEDGGVEQPELDLQLRWLERASEKGNAGLTSRRFRLQLD